MCKFPIIIKGMKVPCGRCIDCRIQRVAEWASRIMHEMDSWDSGTFVTLTYDKDHIKSESLIKTDLQKFFKRLRKDLDFEDRKIKYFACGEYGTLGDRPHFHAIIFGVSPQENQLIKDNWPYGFVHTGTVTYQSARYVASYIIKKVNGKQKEDHYRGKEPEFVCSSNGLGLKWAQKNKKRITENGFITQNGVKMSIPKYYFKKLDMDSWKAVREGNERKQEKADREIQKLGVKGAGENSLQLGKQKQSEYKSKYEVNPIKRDVL